MEHHEKIINFMGWRRITTVLSTLLIAISIGSLLFNGLRFGMDFTGGAQIEVSYDREIELEQVRLALANAGFPDAKVAYFGSNKDVVVRVQEGKLGELGAQLLRALKAGYAGEINLQRTEYVGPHVGEGLREQAILGVLVALAGVMIYVMARFQYKFGVGAIVSLLHDVIVVLGAFSIAQWEFDLPVLAALLAVVGYSINDTIVVSDRIRQNFRKLRKGGAEEIISLSITQTLDRTVMTSLTTLLVVIALFFFGGEALHGFATALFIGIVAGTYSSIYVAASVLIAMNVNREDLLLPVKEAADSDSLP